MVDHGLVGVREQTDPRRVCLEAHGSIVTSVHHEDISDPPIDGGGRRGDLFDEGGV